MWYFACILHFAFIIFKLGHSTAHLNLHKINYFDFESVFRVRFNDSWFVFHYFSWSFEEPNFNRKHIFHKSVRVNRTQGYGIKLFATKLFANAIILKTFLWTISFIIQFFIEQKFCKHHFWRNRKQNDKTRQLTIKAFTYYFIYSRVRKAFRKIMQHKEIWFVL